MPGNFIPRLLSINNKMAEEEKTPDFTKEEKYEAGNVAMRYAASEDYARADAALKLIALDDDGRLLINSRYFSTPQGISEASGIFGKQYRDQLSKRTLGELKHFYDNAMSGMSDEAREKAEEFFAKYSSKKLGDVELAYADAASRLRDKDGYKRSLAAAGLKGEELEEAYKKGIKKAEKDRESYELLMAIRPLFQETREEPIERKVRESLLEKILNPQEE